MLRVTAPGSQRCFLPARSVARSRRIILNGRPDEALPGLHHALRISPRDTISAEWQYRIAMAHFTSAPYELACEWGQTAADTNPACRGPRSMRRRCSASGRQPQRDNLSAST